LETKTDNRENINVLKSQQKDLREKISEMEIEGRQIQLLEAKKLKEDKLIEYRATVNAKRKVLYKYAKDYAKYTSFTNQITHFDKVWGEWKTATKEALNYKEEMNLLFLISRQFTMCIRALHNEINRDILGFRNELIAWQKKVDKRLDKLEG